MRIAFISDIHSNHDALKVAISKLRECNVEKIYCIGDIVGYGAEPGKCIETIEKEAFAAVAGNHDWASVGKTDISYFNKKIRQSILWTSNVLLPHHRSFLASLPLLLENSLWIAVHSTPLFPEEWHYILDAGQAKVQFNGFNQKICFVGHSHIPQVFTDHGEDLRISPKEGKDRFILRISDLRRYIINVGSIGQPRDRDPRGCFVVFDSDSMTVEFVRFNYPISEAQERIISAGLPLFLAERLAAGI